ncbi:hypothetical protein ACFQ15_18340 [Sphingomonas hankookensis]|uniref:hypothetical protein n=1 Tax=Sphingomonas hankookensis TaxID=563996 RepID=UPI001F59017C|nr:hypothetical protein [Sphingomonas hankookensis]
MIAFAAALVMQTPAPVATPEDEIVVLGRKLRSAKFHYALRKTTLRSCRATTKGVDPVIQTAGCEAIGWCAGQQRAAKDEIGACIAERRPAILDRIAELRVAR